MRSSKECTIRVGKVAKRYATIGISLAGSLTVRPGGQTGVCGVQLSVQCHFPRTYLLVQSRAPSWSRVQVEAGSSETRTVRACSRIIKITPSIWLWGEASMKSGACLIHQGCRQAQFPTGVGSPAGRKGGPFLEHSTFSRESYYRLPLDQMLG